MRKLKDVFTDVLKGLRIPESSFLIQKKGRPDLEISFRLCAQDDLTEILALQNTVYKTIADKESFIYTTQEELCESLETDVCIGAYHDNRLAAFTLMITNPDSTRNLGYCLDYGMEQCAKCVTYDTTFVHPDFKGYGLQRLFITLKDKIAIERGAAEALATVSPDNRTSLRNLTAGGFEVADEKKMYGAVNRYVMRKALGSKFAQPEGGQNAVITP